MKLRISALLVALTWASSPVIASEIDDAAMARGHIYIGGFAFRADELRGAERSNNGVQVNVGWNFAPHWALEAHAFSAILETGNNRGSDYYHRGLGLDMQYAFGNREAVTPFLLLGVGMVDNDVVPDFMDDRTLFVNAGAGVVGRLLGLQWLRWRVEGRYQHDKFLEGVQDWRLGAGLEIAFARQTQATVRIEEREVVREVIKEVMPPDTDNDGVIDRFDRCPNTLPGAEVNGHGCVEKAQVVTLDNINFEFNSDRLTPEAIAPVEQAARFLLEQPEVAVEIAGHTDSLGPDDYNRKLSQARANTVRQALLAQGVAMHRIVAIGYGESAPIASNLDERGQAMNRRVEFRLHMLNR